MKVGLLGSKGLGLSGAMIVSSFIGRCAALTHLDLSNNSLIVRNPISVPEAAGATAQTEGLEALCSALSSNRTISSVDLSHNDLRNDGAAVLAEDLKTNRAIQLLDLSGNSIGSDEMMALCKSLAVPQGAMMIIAKG